jgi:hypothetical protein
MNRTPLIYGITMSFFAAAALLATSSLPVMAKRSPGNANPELLKREEMMVYNLNRGPKSARFYQLDSLKATRLVQHDLEKAQHQVEQVDAAYAKVRNRPDDLTMQPTVARLKAALLTAQELESQLEQVSDELKSDIQQTLIRQK